MTMAAIARPSLQNKMKLKRKDGKLTAYGLACGYVERYGDAGIKLMRNGHGVYFVYGPENCAPFRLLKDARAYARKLARG